MKEAAIKVISSKTSVLRDVIEVIEDHGATSTYMHYFMKDKGIYTGKSLICVELTGFEDLKDIIEDIKRVPGVEGVEMERSLDKIYGSRIIVIGGGAQVSQVATGAISEADRHNLRGERISVDTIPLVGEEGLSNAVSAVSRLHRASILVLAGSLMGGKISKEVENLKKEGIPVISLQMAGSVPKHADLVVTDPLQAGTFAAMQVAKTASFDLNKLRTREF